MQKNELRSCKLPSKISISLLFNSSPKNMVKSLRFIIALLLSLLSLQSSASSIAYPSKSKQLSWKPRVFHYEGFLSPEECDHLISLARPQLEKSYVTDDETGKSTLSDVRTSSGMFIKKGKDSIVTDIEERIAAWTFLPKENGEDAQVLRYEYGEKYEPHYDYFVDPVNIARGGHRIATVLMYLTDVEEGGETVFPEAQKVLQRGKHLEEDNLSVCGRQGIAVKPRKGDAILFFNLHPDATTDSSSLHAGCPVIKGEKWSATKWIHVDAFDKIVSKQGNCTDMNENCEKWAALGECTKNPEYMVGTTELHGYCMRSCHVC